MAPREDEGRGRRRSAQPGEDTARVRGVGQADPRPRQQEMSVVRDALPQEAGKALRRAQQPEWTQPMLATLTTRTFSDPEWIFERRAVPGVPAGADRPADVPEPQAGQQ